MKINLPAPYSLNTLKKTLKNSKSYPGFNEIVRFERV